MQRTIKFLTLSILLLTLTLLTAPLTLAQEGDGEADAVVRAVFFYSPTCEHCEKVAREDFPPLREKYGNQLDILRINITTDKGEAAYNIATTLYNIPQNRMGVPRLIVGDQVMIGSVEIPERFPGLIEQYLAQGGVDWPDIPDLPVDEPLARLTRTELFMQDPVGNSIATLVLVGLIAALVAVAKPRPWQKTLAERALPWGFVVALIIGLIAASYLSYVETTQTTAVCGPVGDCNAVQQSKYSKLFGVLPVAVLGVLGYAAVGVSFAYGGLGQGDVAQRAPAATFLLAVFGTVFSAGLTYMEPFVIGATCMWCLTSAVAMAALMLLSAGPGWAVLKPRKRGSTKHRAKRKAVKQPRKSGGKKQR